MCLPFRPGPLLEDIGLGHESLQGSSFRLVRLGGDRTAGIRVNIQSVQQCHADVQALNRHNGVMNSTWTTVILARW
jgi:hypothetical protein